MSGRELMTRDEVRVLDNRYALLFVRGERPVMDFKYDIYEAPECEADCRRRAAAVYSRRADAGGCDPRV